MNLQPMEFTTLAWLSPERLETLVRVSILLFIVLPLVWMAGKAAGRFVEKRSTPHHALMARKVIIYVGFVLVFVMALSDLGFKTHPAPERGWDRRNRDRLCRANHPIQFHQRYLSHHRKNPLPLAM